MGGYLILAGRRRREADGRGGDANKEEKRTRSYLLYLPYLSYPFYLPYPYYLCYLSYPDSMAAAEGTHASGNGGGRSTNEMAKCA